MSAPPLWALPAFSPGDVLGDASERVADLGYAAVLLFVAGDAVFPPVPAETSVVAAAVFAAAGDLSLWLIVLAAAAGALLGDSAAFWIGRAGGVRIRRFLVRFAGRDRVAAAERMVARQGGLLVFTGRFLPGLRTGINMACGAGAMSYGRFLVVDAAAATVWAFQTTLIGYFTGRLLGGSTWLAVLVAVTIAGALASVVVERERRRVAAERRAMEEETEGSVSPAA